MAMEIRRRDLDGRHDNRTGYFHQAAHRHGPSSQLTVRGALAVGPAKQPAGHETIGALAGHAPQSRCPRGRLENARLPLAQTVGPISTLVLEQVTKVFAGKHAEQATAAAMDDGKLEVDDGGTAVARDQ